MILNNVDWCLFGFILANLLVAVPCSDPALDDPNLFPSLPMEPTSRRAPFSCPFDAYEKSPPKAETLGGCPFSRSG